MKAVILVGGEGTRLRPLTLHTPKPLLPIANIPFIERQIKSLVKHGIDDVVLSLGYLPDAFESYFHANPIEGVHIGYAVENEPLGTAGAIKFAAGDCAEKFVVCNGDVLTDMDISSLVSFHESRNSMATIALTYVEDPSAFGVVPTHEDGEVIAFVEKPPLESAPSHWINAGIYVLTPEFLELIPSDINVSIERETFPLVLEKGAMYAMESEAYWLDIGTPSQYLRAHSDYLDNRERFGKEDNLREVSPNIFSDGDVELGEGTIAISPCLIGSGSVVGRNCELGSATIGRRCIIEDSVKMTNSVVMSGTKIGEFSTLDSTVVGEASDISDHADLGEFTLIAAHEKIAPNASLRGERVGSVV